MEHFDIQGELDARKSKEYEFLNVRQLDQEKLQELLEGSKNYFLPSGIKIDDATFLDADSRYLLKGLVSSVNASGVRPKSSLKIRPETPLDISSRAMIRLVNKLKPDKSAHNWSVLVDLSPPSTHSNIVESGAGEIVTTSGYRTTVFEDGTIRYVPGYMHDNKPTYRSPYNNNVELDEYRNHISLLKSNSDPEAIKESVLKILMYHDIPWVESHSDQS